VIESVPAVRDEAARAALYGQLESLIESGDLDLRRAAMRSAVQLGGQRRETFERLAGLIDGGDPVISRSAHMAMNEVAFVDWPNGFEEHRMPVIDAEVLARGREVFHREGLCVTCHQPHGKGVAGSYPPLNGTPRVLGSDRTLARIVLHGLRGRISVHGATYRSAMAPLGPVLADAEVADVLTYVRNEWGNRASRVNEATVAEIRATERRRTTGWTDAQLASAEIEDQLIAMRAAGDDDSEGAMVAGPDGASGIGKIGIWVAVGVIGLILLYMIGSVVTMGSDKRESAGV